MISKRRRVSDGADLLAVSQFDAVGLRPLTSSYLGDTGPWTAEYDALGRATRLQGPDGVVHTVEYGFDSGRSAFFDCRQNSFSLDQTCRYYHTSGQIKSVEYNVAGSPGARQVTEYAYDSKWRPRTIINTVGSTTVSRTDLTYDVRSQIATARLENFLTGEVSSETYQYDYAGNLASRTDGDGFRDDYVYDETGFPKEYQLSKETQASASPMHWLTPDAYADGPVIVGDQSRTPAAGCDGTQQKKGDGVDQQNNDRPRPTGPAIAANENPGGTPPEPGFPPGATTPPTIAGGGQAAQAAAEAAQGAAQEAAQAAQAAQEAAQAAAGAAQAAQQAEAAAAQGGQDAQAAQMQAQAAQAQAAQAQAKAMMAAAGAQAAGAQAQFAQQQAQAAQAQGVQQAMDAAAAGAAAAAAQQAAQQAAQGAGQAGQAAAAAGAAAAQAGMAAQQAAQVNAGAMAAGQQAANAAQQAGNAGQQAANAGQIAAGGAQAGAQAAGQAAAGAQAAAQGLQQNAAAAAQAAGAAAAGAAQFAQQAAQFAQQAQQFQQQQVVQQQVQPNPQYCFNPNEGTCYATTFTPGPNETCFASEDDCFNNCPTDVGCCGESILNPCYCGDGCTASPSGGPGCHSTQAACEVDRELHQSLEMLDDAGIY